MKCLLISCAFVIAATVVQADVVTDSIAAASEAYASGDVNATSTALKAALSDIALQQSAVFEAILPAAPEGYTRTESAEFGAALAMVGGGIGAEASYSGSDATFSMSIMADNQLVGGMLGMFADTGTLAMMGTVETVGDVNIVTADDGSIMAIVAGRYMVSAQGAPAEVMLPVFKTIDFAKLTEMAGQ